MTEKDIEKLADLAKIEISEEQKSAFIKDFEGILEYVKQIESVDVGGVEESFFLKNIARKDQNPNETGALSEALISAAPDTKDGFVKVNKIL